MLSEDHVSRVNEIIAKLITSIHRSLALLPYNVGRLITVV
jgi:hypothetical protein